MRRVIMKAGEEFSSKYINRTGAFNATAMTAATNIIEDVRNRGDQALRELTAKFDGVEVESFRVDEAAIAEGAAKCDPHVYASLEHAAAQIRDFHQRQVQQSWIYARPDGAILGAKVTPLASAGIYVPGGRALYPSSLLMNALPAAVAGVERIVCVTPPTKDGTLDSAILAACQIAGITEIYTVGGAQAIAALAYGTETIPRVDKIVGPGNAFVAEAKKQVFGRVSIDMIAGPSEILVVADGGSNPRHVAADLLSQAEHDKMASAVLVTDSMELARAVAEQLEIQIPRLERAEIARASIDQNGKIIVADSLMRAIDIANEIAPEHLELCVDNPFDYLDAIRHAGSVFLGRNCPEALGDYFAGPNHTLPTSGTARFSSPLGVDDFIKKTQYTYFTRDALARVAPKIARFAETEGLTGHARSAMIRTEEEQ